MKSTVKMYEIYNVIFSDGEILREATLPEIPAQIAANKFAAMSCIDFAAMLSGKEA